MWGGTDTEVRGSTEQLTQEKKNPLLPLPGLKPATLCSQARPFNHWATPLPNTQWFWSLHIWIKKRERERERERERARELSAEGRQCSSWKTETEPKNHMYTQIRKPPFSTQYTLLAIIQISLHDTPVTVTSVKKCHAASQFSLSFSPP